MAGSGRRPGIEPQATGEQLPPHGAQAFEASRRRGRPGRRHPDPDFCPDELASGKLIRPFDLECTDGRSYWLAYPENRRSVPKIKAFRNWILNEDAAQGAVSIAHFGRVKQRGVSSLGNRQR